MFPIKCSAPNKLDSPASEADKIRSAAVRLSSFLSGPSPLWLCEELTEQFGRPVLLKLDHELPSGAYKIRGAYNKISQVLNGLSEGHPRPQFVASSSGNHALACCHVWQSLGVTGSAVYVPDTVAPAKEAKLRQLEQTGLIQLIKTGRECMEAELAGEEFSQRTPGSVYLPPCSDWDLIRGQGTSAFELFPDPDCTGWPGQLLSGDWLPASGDGGHVTLLVPTGGAGLLSGVALYAKLGTRVPTTVIGCQPSADCVMAKSVAAGRILSYEEAGARETLCCTAGGIVASSPGFDVCRQHVDRWCCVDERAIARCCLKLERLLTSAGFARAEPASALGLAALEQLAMADEASDKLPPGPVVIFVTGRNIDEAEMEAVRKVAAGNGDQ